MDFSSFLFTCQFIPENYVHWSETPDSHIYSADLPGVRKEEIKVETEDSTYLIIRTEATGAESPAPARIFKRKFRLPEMVDINGISVIYVNGILSVTVPRSFVRKGFYIELGDLSNQLYSPAKAA